MTVVTRKLMIDGTLAPSAVNFLNEIPEQALFHNEHRLRHPATLYRLSLEKIADAFCPVAEGYLLETDNLRRDPNAPLEMTQLLKCQVHFLRVLQEYLDELWLILKTLVDPKLAAKHGEFAEQYVIENKLPGARSFRDAVECYKSTLRIANKLKHQQCHLRAVGVWFHDSVHLGYCLEEPDANGVLGPSPEIHPDHGAFSFARDLTWHLAHVYLCSEKLVKAIARALSARGMSAPHKIANDHPKWNAVTSILRKIPMAYFPKEMEQAIAKFSFDESSQMLTVKVPFRMHLRLPHPLRVRYVFPVHPHGLSCSPPIP